MISPTSARATRRPPGRSKRRLITLGIALAAAGGLAGFLAPAASASVEGGVDMNAACVTQYADPSDFAVVFGNNVYDWGCEDVFGDFLGGINVDEQCSQQYTPDSLASFYDYNNPYSWYCFS